MAVFPTINAAGVVAQLPYTEIDQWVVHESSLACGKSYTAAQHTFPLKKFIVRYPSIEKVESDILEAFFDLMGGRTGEFDFTDDGGITYPFTRFDQDELVINYVQPGQHSLEIKLSAAHS